MTGRRKERGDLVSAFKSIACKKSKMRVGDAMRTVTIAEAVLLNNWRLAIQGNQKALFNLWPLLEEAASLPYRTDTERLIDSGYLKPDGQIADAFKESWEEFQALRAERDSLKAELKRRKRERAEKRRHEAQSDDTRDPLA